MADTESDERVFLSAEEALAMLPEGEYVHTFRNPGATLIGADWERETLVKAIRASRSRELSGTLATSMDHGLVIDDGGRLFIETRKPVDAQG